MCIKKKNIVVREIRIIPIQINEHNPKAQSVCFPDEPVDFNQFYENLYNQLKNYDTQGSNQTQVGVSVRESNSYNNTNRR
jgi:hypothetical protein